LPAAGPDPGRQPARSGASSVSRRTLLGVGLPDDLALPVAEALAAASVPFALVTGYVSTDRPETRPAGAPALQKPFAADAVKGVLVALLDGSTT
jgi:hypothetical protein